MTPVSWLGKTFRARQRRRFGSSDTAVFALPCLNLVIIAAIVFFNANRLTLKPGVVVDLPDGQSGEGVEDAADMLLIRAYDNSATYAFFNDVRFTIGDDAQSEALASELSALRADGRPVNLIAASNIPHGDVMAAVAIARRAGVSKVNLATKANVPASKPPMPVSAQGETRADSSARTIHTHDRDMHFSLMTLPR